jgi:hypothetical protein
MADSHIQQCIEWLDWYSQQYGTSQKDPAAFVRLIRATADYLNWMKSVNYSLATQHLHRRQLELFLDFVKNRRLHWQQLFTVNTREHFKKISGLATTAAINGLSRYLVEQGQIKTSLPQHPQQRKLTGTFENYLQFRQDGHQTDTHQLVAIRRVLFAITSTSRISHCTSFVSKISMPLWQNFVNPFRRAPAVPIEPLCAAF